MLRLSLPDQLLESERGRAILIGQFHALRRQIPLMYALVFVDSLFLSFAAYGTVSPWWSLGVPAVLGVLSAARALFWLHRGAFAPDPDTIARYLRSTIIVSAVLSFGFGGWGLMLFAEGDLVRRSCIALYIFIGAISCCYCLQTLPRAGQAMLICGALPVTICLIFSHDLLLRGMGFNTLLVGLVVVWMLQTNYDSFVETLDSRSHMAAEQLRAQGAEQRAHQLAYHDPLTGLPNRRALAEALERRTALGEEGVPLGLLIIDLDRFKSINDTYGHDGGDDVLREFAKRLRKNVRGIDLACRFGGEEFVVVMPDTDGAVAEKVAERIRAEIAQAPFAVGDDGKAIEVTVSVGVSSLLKGADSVAALMKRADLALYEAKSGGRNRVVAKAA